MAWPLRYRSCAAAIVKVECISTGFCGVGDRLTAINEREVKDTATRMRQVYRVGAWSKATYSVIRQSVPVDMTVILVPAERSLNCWLRFIALIYLGIGLYVFAALDGAEFDPFLYFSAWSRSFFTPSSSAAN